MIRLATVSPCYNEEEVLPIFYKEIDEISKKIDNVNFEFLFVDDGSKDRTLSIIKELAKLEQMPAPSFNHKSLLSCVY